MIESFDEQTLRALCDVLGDTDHGLTGTEIAQLLRDSGVADTNPDITKRKRLFEALAARQRQDRCANNVARFIVEAMKPVRYVSALDKFRSRLTALNAVLAFAALSLGDDGELRQASTAARTITEAQERASKLRRALIERRVHADVLRFCRAELLQDNYFHAVFEATKSVADKIRTLSGLTSDGAALVDQALGAGAAGYPRLALNSLQNETQRSEQSGFSNLIKGLFGAFRNTTAHAPKITWPVTEQDALDILTLASLLHRRLDAAVRTHVP